MLLRLLWHSWWWWCVSVVATVSWEPLRIPTSQTGFFGLCWASWAFRHNSAQTSVSRECCGKCLQSHMSVVARVSRGSVVANVSYECCGECLEGAHRQPSTQVWSRFPDCWRMISNPPSRIHQILRTNVITVQFIARAAQIRLAPTPIFWVCDTQTKNHTQGSPPDNE